MEGNVRSSLLQSDRSLSACGGNYESQKIKNPQCRSQFHNSLETRVHQGVMDGYRTKTKLWSINSTKSDDLSDMGPDDCHKSKAAIHCFECNEIVHIS